MFLFLIWLDNYQKKSALILTGLLLIIIVIGVIISSINLIVVSLVVILALLGLLVFRQGLFLKRDKARDAFFEEFNRQQWRIKLRKLIELGQILLQAGMEVEGLDQKIKLLQKLEVDLQSEKAQTDRDLSSMNMRVFELEKNTKILELNISGLKAENKFLFAQNQKLKQRLQELQK